MGLSPTGNSDKELCEEDSPDFVHEHLFTVHRSRYRVHGTVHTAPCAGPGSGHA